MYLEVSKDTLAHKVCPICRAPIHIVKSSLPSHNRTIVYAPGIGYRYLKDLLAKTYYSLASGVFWRYFYLPQQIDTRAPPRRVQVYLHTTEERGTIDFQGGHQ